MTAERYRPREEFGMPLPRHLRPGVNGSDHVREPFELQVMTARELCDLPDPDRSDEILGPLLVRGYRLVLGAGTGEGKTTLCLAMARAVATGGQLLDWTADAGRVLIIDAEQGVRTAKRRLREAGLEESDAIDYVRVPDGLSLNTDDDQAYVIEMQLAAGEYSMVLADPLYKLHTGQSNDEREAVDLMRRFDGWREKYGFALVIPVHLRKPPVGAKFSMNEFHGSTAYTRGAETVLGLQRVRDGYSRLWFFKDRDGDLPATGTAWGLLFDRERGYRRDPEDEKPKQTAAERIRELLEAQPGITEAQITEALGLSDRTVRDKLKLFRDRGYADCKRAGANGPKQWSLTADPDAELARLEEKWGES